MKTTTDGSLSRYRPTPPLGLPKFGWGLCRLDVQILTLQYMYSLGQKHTLDSTVCSENIPLNVVFQVKLFFSSGHEFRHYLEVLNTCPVNHARWCVISTMEMEKCENMIMAFSARNLKPELNCIRADSVRECMDKIAEGDADMVTLDAADIYTAGK